jgi:hypothetical protein
MTTPDGAAHDAVFALLVTAAGLGGSILPTPSFDEDTARPTEAAMNYAGNSVESWLNLKPDDARYIRSEYGGDGIEIRHIEAVCDIEWVVIGKGSRPGSSVSPRRSLFQDGLAALGVALAGPRVLTVAGVGTAYMRLDDQPLGPANERSILANLPNVSAARLTVTILMAVPSPIG